MGDGSNGRDIWPFLIEVDGQIIFAEINPEFHDNLIDTQDDMDWYVYLQEQEHKLVFPLEHFLP